MKYPTIVNNIPKDSNKYDNTIKKKKKYSFKGNSTVELCSNIDSAIEKIRKHIIDGSIVLFKASHSMEFDLLIGKIWPDLRKEMYCEQDDERKWLVDVEISQLREM